MKLNKRKGFTLIELLVVITIIGILATGAVNVYTSQIQKARDSTRITDITAIKTAVEQFYQDNDEYPHSSSTSSDGVLAFSWVTIYLPKLPKDPKSWQARAGSAFDYIYTVWQDDNSIVGQDYEVSTTFEQEWNITKKAKLDGWNDDKRLEIWIDLKWNDTKVTWKITATTLKCVATGWAVTACSSEGKKLVIKWN